jgi:mannose-6-phosphate isomerase
MQDCNSGELYPLKFAVLPKEKVWGGNRIAELFPQQSPADRPIGEVWVVWDQLRVENGTWKGRKLADLVREDPQAILGSRLSDEYDAEFPLLVKILDARKTLSVQVHPDDGYAQRYEGEPFGKAEMWYVLDVEPGSQLIHGVSQPLTRAEAKQAIESGTLQDVLAHVDVAQGDVILNVPGTIHALGDGILLYELQQSSDLTYRLYDWDRKDPARPLHIVKSLDVANLTPYDGHKIEPIEIRESGGTRTFLCACKYFAAELLTVEFQLVEAPAGVCCHVLTVLQGTGSLRTGLQPGGGIPLEPGESLLVPAGLQEYELDGGADGQPLVLIKAYVPDLATDIVDPLRSKGVAKRMIAQLGGDSMHSDLGRILYG